MRLYRLVAGQNYAPAEEGLAELYESGRGGLEKNDREAARLYQQAADQNDATAQNKLGLMYQNGTGVNENDIKPSSYSNKRLLREMQKGKRILVKLTKMA